MRPLLFLLALVCLIRTSFDAFCATTLTATWDTVPNAEFYNFYEQVNGAWVWRGSPTAPPFKFVANKGTRTYAMTSQNAVGESPTKSNTVTIRIKH